MAAIQEACPRCGGPFHVGQRFCQRCGGGLPAAPVTPTPAPGTPWAASAASTSRFTARTVAAVAGLAGATIGSFTSWIGTAGVGGTAFEETTAFRFNKWFDATDFPTDGLLALALGVGGLVLVAACLVGRIQRTNLRNIALVLGPALVAFAALQMYYIKTLDTGDQPTPDLGAGLYLMVFGGALALASAWLSDSPLLEES